jgi:hypothetical protein
MGFFLVTLVSFAILLEFGLSEGKTEYRRPPPADVLPLHDPRLTKKGGAHDPEQIMIALAGPGVAISWVTHPQVNSAVALYLRAYLSQQEGLFLENLT